MSNQRLKCERQQRGWSQERVAEQVHTDPGTISRWERGFSSPSPRFRERLCELYGKTAQELGLLESASAAENASVNEMEQELFVATLPGTSEEPLSPSVVTGFRLLACLSILFGWLTGLLVLFFYRSSRFVNVYSVQSVCFFGIANIIVFVSSVYAKPTFEEASGLRLLLNFIGSMTAFIALLVWIFAMIQALRGRYYRFPLIGKYCERIAATLTATV